MRQIDKQELAKRYAVGSLPPEQKPIVFSLILEDAEFRALLRDELEWVRRMRRCRAALAPVRKTEMFAKIQVRLMNEDAAGRGTFVQAANEAVLRQFLPGIAFTFIQPVLSS